MIFGEMKQKLSVLPTPDRHQINDAIHRFVASGGEIQKLDPSPCLLYTSPSPRDRG